MLAKYNTATTTLCRRCSGQLLNKAYHERMADLADWLIERQKALSDEQFERSIAKLTNRRLRRIVRKARQLTLTKRLVREFNQLIKEKNNGTE